MCAFAETVSGLIPKQSLWGISRDKFQKQSNQKYESLESGKTKMLRRSGIKVNGYKLDGYFVFDFSTWDSTGYTYSGLSKVVYLLSGKPTSDEITSAFQTLVQAMKKSAGQPDSEKKTLATWEKNNYTVEIGKGKFKKYTGSDKQNVAIVITAKNISRPQTPKPTVEPTPKYKYISPTPKPTKTPKPKKVTKTYTNYNEGGGSYILNTKTMKFHLPGCRDVNKMSSENRMDVSWSRSTVLSNGYSPCGHCNP